MFLKVEIVSFWPHLSNFDLVCSQIGHVWATWLHFFVSYCGQRGSVSDIAEGKRAQFWPTL